MRTCLSAIAGRVRGISARIDNRMRLNPNWPFVRDVARLIWRYKIYGLAILLVTIFQEIVALWPVTLLGRFVDQLQAGDIGHVVWLFMGASLLHPAVTRGNIILRHKMFYETDFEKRVELTLQEAGHTDSDDVEQASTAHTRAVNAASGITNATYHVLGSFTPLIIKIIIVSGSLLTYSKSIGAAYLASLSVPLLMTLVFNRNLRVLRDTQYSVISRASGAGVKAIAERGSPITQGKLREALQQRKEVLISLVCKSQIFLFIRRVALIGGQFLAIFLALRLRDKLGLTPGDFTQIAGYTTQVTVAFLNTASFLDAIISYSRAYHVFTQAHSG
ncbi:MAG: hypothetical protein U9R48_06920 [Chloroflexota bacterium]|nr:hypothetical protein [Chloroflexota bacterium]